jgi:hypothetical protein
LGCYANGARHHLLNAFRIQRAEIVAWQGSGVLYEAVLAREAGRAGDYQRLYKLALQHYAEADRAGSGNPGVYGSLAKKWQDKPAELVATTNLGCKSFHDAGRLETRKAALAKAEHKSKCWNGK